MHSYNTYWIIFKDDSPHEDNIYGVSNCWFSVEVRDLVGVHVCKIIAIVQYVVIILAVLGSLHAH